MTNGQKAEQIKAYVEEACNDFLTAYKDVEKVEYSNSISTELLCIEYQII